MSGLHFSRVAIALQVKVSARLLEQHGMDSPGLLGAALAEQVTAYVQRERLGYYPALEYFRMVPEIDPGLLDAVDRLAWRVCGLVRDEIRGRLQPVFSMLRFESVQIVANTMPTIRPAKVHALHELARHYSPDQVRLNLLASSLRRQDNDPATAVALAGHLVRRWLENRFSSLQINAIRYLQATQSNSSPETLLCQKS